MVETRRTSGSTPVVSPDLLDAAQRAAEELGKDVADVSIVEIAKRAGISRSTLLRRLGGSRDRMDEALRAAGVDPGGQPSVRERAIQAGGRIISIRGLSAATLESIAGEANCSVYSLYSVFGGRAGLLQAVFERHRPTVPIDSDIDLSADPISSVSQLFMRIATAWTREPRVVPAILAEIMANPHDPAVTELIEFIVPRSPMMNLADWLDEQITAGRIRDFPRSLLLQQMVAPLLMHVLLGTYTARASQHPVPDLEQTCSILAENFVRSLVITPNDQ